MRLVRWTAVSQLLRLWALAAKTPKRAAVLECLGFPPPYETMWYGA